MYLRTGFYHEHKGQKELAAEERKQVSMPPAKTPISWSPLAHPFHIQTSSGSWQARCHIAACSHPCCSPDCHLLNPEIPEEGKPPPRDRGSAKATGSRAGDTSIFKAAAPRALMHRQDEAYLGQALSKTRVAQQPGREPCKEEMTRLEPADEEGTCHSGLQKGTICPTHVTGNTLGATPPPTAGARLIAHAHRPPHHRGSSSVSCRASQALTPPGRQSFLGCRALLDHLLPAPHNPRTACIGKDL